MEKTQDELSERYVELYTADGIAKQARTDKRTFTVVVIGHNDNKPFEQMAVSRQELGNMLARDFNLITDSYAYGYPLGDDHIVHGKGEARAIVEQHLQNKR